MIIPIRCYTCGKLIGDKWEYYNDLLKSGKSQPEAFEILKLKRYCCRRIILGHVDIIDTIMQYDYKLDSYKVEKTDNLMNVLNNKEETVPLFK